MRAVFYVHEAILCYTSLSHLLQQKIQDETCEILIKYVCLVQVGKHPASQDGNCYMLRWNDSKNIKNKLKTQTDLVPFKHRHNDLVGKTRM
jgi:hypothetical protein